MEQETPAAIAIIPARGGSKRVPGKNTRMLSGRPAIAYTIDAAVMSGVFERVIVSTDSSDIADIAVACGAEVPFTRSASISDDYTPVSVVTIQRSQDLPEVFCPTGAVWFGKTEAVVRSGTFHLDGRTGCEIPWDHAVDIDTEDDWRMAELLLDARARNQQS
jgi:CMP-N-acetylneuraminic acid synthetase